MTEAKTSRFAVIILATICITYLVENFLRSAAGALTPVLMDELGVSYGAMGLLTTAFFLTYGLMQIPAGIMGDTIGPRKTIIWSTAVTVIGAFLVPLLITDVDECYGGIKKRLAVPQVIR